MKIEYRGYTIGVTASNVGVIFRNNLLFGWTIVGWVATLIWAIVEPPDLKEDSKRMVVGDRHCQRRRGGGKALIRAVYK